MRNKKKIHLFKKPHRLALASMLEGWKPITKNKSSKHNSQEVAAAQKKLRKKGYNY